MTTAADLATIVDALLGDQPRIPAAGIAVHWGDGTEAAVAHGVADPATGAAFTPAHALRIASCTKPFVAAAVLDLAGQGRVALDAPVITQVAADIAELVGRFEHGQVITVRQLLHHRSGLVDHTMFPEFELPPTTQWTAVQQLAIAVSKPALFDPGTAFSYSDSGYVLLGQLVEHLTGEPLAAAVRRSAAIDTASTPSIHWETAEPTPPGLQRAHQLYEDHDTHDWNPSLDMFGGGGLVATLPDLARWWSAWFASDHADAHLASIESTALASGEPFAAGPQVGLGLFGRTVSGHHVWSHGGFWGLETAHVPDLGVSVAVAHTHRATGLPSARPLADAVIDAIS